MLQHSKFSSSSINFGGYNGEEKLWECLWTTISKI